MRIGLFSDTYLPDLNGVTSSVVILQQALEKLGHEVFVITNHKGMLSSQREGNVLRLPGIELKWLYGYTLSSPIQLSAKDEIRQMNLDIIHAHTEFGIGMFARIVAKELGIPMVTTYHTMYEDYSHYINLLGFDSMDKMAKKVITNISRIVSDSADAVISPSEKTKEALLKYGVSAPIYVIPTGLDLSQFSVENVDKADIEKIREEYHLSTDDHILIYLGRIAPEKSIDLVIRGFHKAAKADPHNKLLIVGGGPSLDDLRDLVKKLDLQDSIILTDRQPREIVPAFYVLSDAFVSASTSETQGMTYIEAMSCSLPVFAVQDEVIEDLVEEGKTGFIITEENFSDKVITYFSLEPAQQLEMHQAARQKVLKYDCLAFGEAVLKAYRDAIQSYHLTYTIKKVKTTQDTVKLTLVDSQNDESEIVVSLEDYFTFELKKEGILHQFTLEELRKREALILAYNLCIKKIANRDRTRKEMYDLLVKENTLNIKQVNDMIDVLEAKGYINDEALLYATIERSKNSNDGKHKVLRSLVKRGLPYEKVQDAMNAISDISEQGKAMTYIERIFDTVHDRSVKMKKQILMTRLISHGYAYELAKEVIESFDYREDEANEKQVIEKAIQKALRTYSRKYEGEELKRAVLQSLIRKGFSSEDVLMRVGKMEEFND